MATDRAYAEDFIRNSVGQGKIFTLTFEAVDPMLTRELFEAAHSYTKDPKAAKLIAGCKVLTIYSGDETARLRYKLTQCHSIINAP